MKRFLSKIAIFAVIILVLDVLCGVVSGFLRKNAKGGSTYEDYYIAEKCDADILIFGSSRASYHYDPSVFTAYLGESCYNCGKEGNGTILAYARFGMITNRHTPKLVIYDLNPKFDYLASGDYSENFLHIKAYYGNDSVKKAMAPFLDTEDQIKLVSNLYRNNSRLLSDILDNLMIRYQNENGFAPLYGEMKNNAAIAGNNPSYPVDEKKLHLFERFILDCQEKQIPLVFVVSPKYQSAGADEFALAEEFAAKYQIPFLNYLDADGISHQTQFFQDNTHMNEAGAKKFSELIAKEIKSRGIISANQKKS